MYPVVQNQFPDCIKYNKFSLKLLNQFETIFVVMIFATSSTNMLSQSVVKHGPHMLFKFLIDQIQKRKKSSLKVRDQLEPNWQEWYMAGPSQIANSVPIYETICWGNSSFLFVKWKRVSVCLSPIQQFYSYIMVGPSWFLVIWWWGPLCSRPTLWVGFV